MKLIQKCGVKPTCSATPKGGKKTAQIRRTRSIKTSCKTETILLYVVLLGAKESGTITKVKNVISWFKRFWSAKEEIPLYPHNQIRRKVDTDSIRARLNGLGWQLLELPIKKQNTIARWRVVASKGEKSLEAGGQTLDEAMTNVGQSLGVIPRT